MAATLAVISVAATGCPDDGGTGLADAVTPSAPPTTTQPPNRPPELQVDSFRWTVGERLEASLSVGDPDGYVTRITWRRPPPGFSLPRWGRRLVRLDASGRRDVGRAGHGHR